MPYAADPWSNTTPTNANTVKDTVPAELIALKQVNLDRLRLVATGIQFSQQWTLTNGSAVAVGLPAMIQTALNKGAYAHAQPTGSVYTVDQAGWFRVTARMTRNASNNNFPNNWGGAPTLSLYEQLVVQKALAATPTTFVDQGVISIPGNKYVGTDSDVGMSVTAVVSCAIGDNIRLANNMIMNAAWAAATGPQFSGISASTGIADSLVIEYMRAP